MDRNRLPLVLPKIAGDLSSNAVDLPLIIAQS